MRIFYFSPGVSMLTQRASGLLLHPSSLAGPFGIGDMGPAARQFVDFLVRAGQSYWQTLPLGPTGYGDSPYSALSAFAGNPLLISPELLAAVGDLEPADLDPWRKKGERTDFSWAENCRRPLLEKAEDTFFRFATTERRRQFEDFCRRQAFWLDDYALFRVLREQFDRQCWNSWPSELRDRDESTLDKWRHRLRARIRQHYYQQFVFFEQWQGLKNYANSRGVSIFGDMPIFVAQDSSDTWGHRQFFHLDAHGNPPLVAGVPPDYFSRTGQRWGNPLFNWEKLAEQDYAWWRQRMARNLELFDLLRIDHFRGFSACWGIPADASTALAGSWQPGPGDRLFEALRQDLGPLPLVAEDLGVITPEVAALRDRWQLPGMKILQFAFDSDDDNPYLPRNHPANAVVYTGTHDNNTTLGWWRELDRTARRRVRDLLGEPCRQMPQDLIRSALQSPARLAVIPLQDLLGLPADDRMNRPGRPDGNWTWRMAENVLTVELADWLREECRRCRRTGT
ncbi:4-alpha-glucanotransferase [Geothermobacter hydrogeniphilus]